MKLALLGDFLILRMGQKIPVIHQNGVLKTNVQLYGISFAYRYFVGFYKCSALEKEGGE